MRSKIILFTALCVFLAIGFLEVASDKRQMQHADRVLQTKERQPDFRFTSAIIDDFQPKFAGNFLASRHAQAQYDWKTASAYLDRVLENDPENFDLLKKSMVLAMGAGDIATAAKRAKTILTLEPDNSLAGLIVSVDDLAAGRPGEALAAVDAMSDGDITDFVKPILKGWAKAAQGEFVAENFNTTTIHSYSGALIALYLGKTEEAEDFARHMLEVGTISTFDAERAADIYAALGHTNEALALYNGANMQEDHSYGLSDKIKAVEDGEQEKIEKLVEPLQIKTPGQGAAIALFDMARILYQEDSDSSAKLFAYMALTLDPDNIDARILLANTLARNNRYDEAIKHFSAMTPDNENYLFVQRHIASLLEEAGRRDEALALLNKLFMEQDDIESLITIGDIYRNDEDYDNALQAYNKAATQIGDTIPKEYWYLLYARGMAYEREGMWKEAEHDLKAALTYQPDHPYLLNYLGYGWADQGKNLDESLELIRRAVALQPDDGYITDSLGWVLYRMGRYADAVPYLEKAVELLPYDPTLNDHLGDAYWQVGRRLEAKFQWERALNNSEDSNLNQQLQAKLEDGVHDAQMIKQAKTDTAAVAK